MRLGVWVFGFRDFRVWGLGSGFRVVGFGFGFGFRVARFRAYSDLGKPETQ